MTLEILQVTPDPTAVEWDSMKSVFTFIVVCLFFALWWLGKDRSRILAALKEEQEYSRSISDKSIEYITKVENNFSILHAIRETGDDTNKLAREIRQEVIRHKGGGFDGDDA